MISYDVAMTTVQEVLQYNTGKQVEFAPTDRLVDLALDSMDLVEITIDLEDAFFFQTDREDLRKLVTVEDLVQLVIRCGRSAD